MLFLLLFTVFRSFLYRVTIWFRRSCSLISKDWKVCLKRVTRKIGKSILIKSQKKMNDWLLEIALKLDLSMIKLLSLCLTFDHLLILKTKSVSFEGQKPWYVHTVYKVCSAYETSLINELYSVNTLFTDKEWYKLLIKISDKYDNNLFILYAPWHLKDNWIFYQRFDCLESCGPPCSFLANSILFSLTKVRW